MKWGRQKLFLGMSLIALSGCRGGGASPAQMQQSAATTPSIQIDMEGDSLIWGYASGAAGSFVQSPDNPPAVVQSGLQAKCGTSVTTLNTAIPGEMVLDSLNGTNQFTAPFATRLLTIKAQIVLADYAVNDSLAETPDQYTAALVQWIADVRAAGKTPVLEEPNPVCDVAHPNVGAYVSIMGSVAASQNVLLIQQYNYVLSLPDWQSMLRPDCIHPTDGLYQLKAQREIAALTPLVKSSQ